MIKAVPLRISGVKALGVTSLYVLPTQAVEGLGLHGGAGGLFVGHTGPSRRRR